MPLRKRSLVSPSTGPRTINSRHQQHNRQHSVPNDYRVNRATLYWGKLYCSQDSQSDRQRDVPISLLWRPKYGVSETTHHKASRRFSKPPSGRRTFTRRGCLQGFSSSNDLAYSLLCPRPPCRVTMALFSCTNSPDTKRSTFPAGAAFCPSDNRPVNVPVRRAPSPLTSLQARPRTMLCEERLLPVLLLLSPFLF